MERDLPSSRPRPGRYGDYPPVIDLSSQLSHTQARKTYSTSLHNIPSVLNQLGTFSDASKVTPRKNCSFMRRLSIDVRTQIYSYLLVNPILSTPEAISKDTDFGANQKYELHTTILGTSKEVYEETSAVLYGLNKFYMVATKSTRMFRFTLADFIGGSALTRYWRENGDIFNIAPESRLNLCKVRQWRVEISCYGSPVQGMIEIPLVSIENTLEYGVTQHLPSHPRTSIPPPSGRRRRENMSMEMVSVLRPSLEYSIVPFCHLISLCEEPPQALEIIIRPQAPGEVPLISEYLGLVPTEAEKLRLIKPLEMLRGVGSLEFTHGESSNRANIAMELSSEERVMESRFKQLVTAKEEDCPVEYPSNIYTKLLSYAQAFERYKPFKQRMAANWLDQNSYRSPPNPYKTKYPNPMPFSNPFGPHDDSYKSYPVNRYVSQAASAVRRYDIEDLKEARKNAIELLEPQYTCIVSEFKKFREFIDAESKRYGIWDGIVRLQHEIDRYRRAMAYAKDTADIDMLIRDQNQRLDKRIGSIDFAEALVVLEEYAEAFEQDIPHETRKQLARIRFEYQGDYEMMEREVAIRKLQEMVVNIPESMNDAAVKFKELYMIAANDMQKQYLEIREARKQLFEDDVIGDVWECPIDLQMEMEDKEINWTVPRDDPSVRTIGNS
ncbi:hypothetical protein NHQ30_011434 [Ciborinia camelliae]|nr:hypothetical protein NHQ30_011434 [Ciborinia camelliae]